MRDERYADLTVSAEGLISFDGENTQVSIILRDEDGIVAEGLNWVELVANVRAALTEARAQGAADERERLAKLASEQAASSGIVASGRTEMDAAFAARWLAGISS